MVKFVALGVTAEVIMIVEDEHLAIGTERLAEEVRRRKSGDSAADDNEVIALAGILGSPRIVELSVPGSMCNLERSRVLAAQAC